VLRPEAPYWCTGYPDGDKGLRLVNDALTIAGVIADDSLVVVARVEKAWTDTARTQVEVWEATAATERGTETLWIP
jgi:Holliday junction resolvase RusA-like endonuclease